MKKTVPFTKQIHFKTMIAEITNIEVTHNLEVKENNTIEGDILVDGSYKMHEASQIEEEFHYQLPFTIEVDDKYDIENAEIGVSDFYFEIINEEDLKVNVDLEIRNVEEKTEELEVEEEPISISKITDDISLEEEVVRNDDEKIPVEVDEKIESLEVPSVDEIEKDLEDINNTDTNCDGDNNDLTNINFFSDKIMESKEESSPLLENKEKVNINPNANSNSYSNIFDTISTDETYVTYYVYIVRESDTIEEILDKYKVTKEDLSSYNDIDSIKVGSKIIIPCHNE